MARKKAGLTQEALADLVGTELSQVGGLERGMRNPSYETLLRFAVALDTRVDVLVRLADQLRDEGFGR